MQLKSVAQMYTLLQNISVTTVAKYKRLHTYTVYTLLQNERVKYVIGSFSRIESMVQLKSVAH